MTVAVEVANGNLVGLLADGIRNGGIKGTATGSCLCSEGR